MIINADSVDEYIAKKGLVPRLTDAEWHEIFQHIANSFGRELWHRCRLVHQTDETFARYSTAFPEAVPKPYRHIRCLEIVVSDSPQLQSLGRWLTDRHVEWRIRHDENPDTKQDDVVGLQLFGYDPERDLLIPSAPAPNQPKP